MDLKDKFQSKKFFNLYRGIVVNNKDPNNGGRVQVRIFELHGAPETATPGGYPTISGEKDTEFNQIDESGLPWAEVMQSIAYIGFYPAPADGADEFAQGIDGKGSKNASKTITRNGKTSGFGQNIIIAEGTWVFCILENGNPNYPIVIGTIASDTEMHKNTSSKDTRIYDSITGHYEEWSDERGFIIFHHRTGTTITMDKDGNMFINIVKDLKEFVGNNSFSHIENNHTEFIGNDYTSKIGNNETQEIGSNSNIKIGSNLTENIGSNATIKAGSNITIQAGSNIVQKGSKIFLN